MLKVGLTGGIGSGKTAVASVFTLLGVPVFVADSRAHDIMTLDAQVKEKIQALLGGDSYTPEGPDRQFIASRVFGDRSLLEKLNAIIHPEVRKDFEDWSAKLTAYSYVIQEAAILFESGGAAFMDENILVWAPEQLRVERVMRRDNTVEELVRSRIQHQMPDVEKVPLSSFIIVNDSAHSIVRQVIELDRVLRFINASR